MTRSEGCTVSINVLFIHFDWIADDFPYLLELETTRPNPCVGRLEMLVSQQASRIAALERELKEEGQVSKLKADLNRVQGERDTLVVKVQNLKNALSGLSDL